MRIRTPCFLRSILTLGCFAALLWGCDLFGPDTVPRVLYVDLEGGSGANSGESAAEPIADPQVAIERAAAGEVDRIVFGGGTIVLQQTLRLRSSVEIRGGFDFEEGEFDTSEISTELTGVPLLIDLQGVGEQQVELRGLTLVPSVDGADEPTSSRAVAVAGSALLLSDVTIAFEQAPYPEVSAVSAESGSVRIESTTISATVEATGDAIAIDAAGTTELTIADSTLDSGSSAEGASIAIRLSDFATLLADSSVIRGGGGHTESHGLLVLDDASAIVEGSVIAGGTTEEPESQLHPRTTGVSARDHGGLILRQNERIEGGSAAGTTIAAIYLGSLAPATVSETEFVLGGLSDDAYALVAQNCARALILDNYLFGAVAGSGTVVRIEGQELTAGPVEFAGNTIELGDIEDAMVGVGVVITGSADARLYRNEIRGGNPLGGSPAGVVGIAVGDSSGSVEIDANEIVLIRDGFPEVSGIYIDHAGDVSVSNNLILTYATDLAVGVRVGYKSGIRVAFNTIVTDLGPAGTNEYAIHASAFDNEGRITGTLAFAPDDMGGDDLILPGSLESNMDEQREVRASAGNDLNDPANVFANPDHDLSDGNNGNWRIIDDPDLDDMMFESVVNPNFALSGGIQHVSEVPAILHDLTGEPRLSDTNTIIDVGAYEL